MTRRSEINDRRPMWRAAMAAALVLGAAPAQAQSYVRAECKPLIAADRLAEGSLTARWYKRFWTGDCNGLGGCMGGSPNWNGIVGQLVARAAPSERQAVLAKACRLGPLIGLEWTRPKDVRRIDSGDLRGFQATLQSSRDVLVGMGKVEAQARAKIAGGGR
ncbi:hypothetical protein [Phenylobacterium sp.]|uniref:hypothetical protein n=1 Tax=Phenylobacterium sp. TaxID=1871053 RepID=UPI002DE5E1A8|nr:hypothetical protein [Phenylobacterium sp.]